MITVWCTLGVAIPLGSSHVRAVRLPGHLLVANWGAGVIDVVSTDVARAERLLCRVKCPFMKPSNLCFHPLSSTVMVTEHDFNGVWTWRWKHRGAPTLSTRHAIEQHRASCECCTKAEHAAESSGAGGAGAGAGAGAPHGRPTASPAASAASVDSTGFVVLSPRLVATRSEPGMSGTTTRAHHRVDDRPVSDGDDHDSIEWV